MLCKRQCAHNESKSNIEHGKESDSVTSSEDLYQNKKLLQSIFNELDILRSLVSFFSGVQVYFAIFGSLLESNMGASCGCEKSSLSDFYLVTVLIGESDNVGCPHVVNKWNYDGLGEAEGHNIVVRLEE